jgi:hypothetical protein
MVSHLLDAESIFAFNKCSLFGKLLAHLVLILNLDAPGLGVHHMTSQELGELFLEQGFSLFLWLEVKTVLEKLLDFFFYLRLVLFSILLHF